MSYIGYKAQDMGFDAHLTLLFLGFEPLPPETQEAIEIFLEEVSFKSSMVIRDHIDMFGPNKDIPVVRVATSQFVRDLRRNLENQFGNASEFKGWNPHITLDLIPSFTICIPYQIYLTDLGLY